MEVLYRLKGNESLLLDDQELVWVVKSGTISLFAIEVNDENHIGDVLRQAAPCLRAEQFVARHRRYLFSVEAGEALFGTAIAHPKSFLAVAIEATELSQITIADLAAQITAGETEATTYIESWVNHLSQIFSTEPTTAFSRHLLLTNQERCTTIALIWQN